MKDKIKNHFKRNWHFWTGLAVLSWVVFVNVFPEGYIFGGGDTYQMIEAKTVFFDRFFDWEGRAVMFYFIFYLLDSLGVSETAQLSWYLGIFIFGSYVSFYLFSGMIFQSKPKGLRVAISLFYALNLYTFFVFTGNWGYSYFPSLYIFLPVLVACLLKFFQNQTIFWVAAFLLVLFFSSSGFGNPAFALSFGIFSFFLVVFLYIFRFFKIKKNLARNLIFLVLFSFLVSAHWLLPISIKMKSGVEGITSSQHVIEFEYIIKKVANPISKSLSLISDEDKYFPHKFPNEKLKTLQPLFFLLAFIPFILVLFGLFGSKKLSAKDLKLFFSFFALLVLFVMLTAKVREPFEIINHYVYHIWGFSTLRGFDKTGIYLPFLLSVLLLISLGGMNNKKIIYTFLGLVLIIPLPFYTGKIQQNIGYRLSETRDYKNSKLSFLVKIPDEYYQIQEAINSDERESHIATLPISRSDGSGISSYPKWQYYGADPVESFYDKDMLVSNLKYIESWDFAREFTFQEEVENAEWIIKMFGIMNATHLLYHKDVDEEYWKATSRKISNLEEDGVIEKIEDNEFFALYKIPNKYYVEHISWQKGRFGLESKEEALDNFDKIKNNTTEADFRKVNPGKFIVKIEDKMPWENLILAEKFDPLWRVYAVDQAGKKNLLQTHFKARGYANGWEIPNDQNISEILIEYHPINLMWKGIAISVATVLLLAFYLIKYQYDKKRGHN